MVLLMEKKSTRERRRARTAQALLDAAMEIITERGVGALSMREIAQRIEYSPSGLYEYYASKEEILDALCEQGFVQLTGQIERAVQGNTAVQRLYELALAYLDFARQHSQLYLLMFNSAPPQIWQGRGLQHLSTNSAYSKLLAIVRAGVESGEFSAASGLDIEQLTYSIWALMHGLAALRLTRLSNASEDIDATNRQVMQAAIERLR
jgi:AcrR family transcriptional regulator